eukprot:1805833-Pleurochrysis_carterae.AAC.1
MGSTARKRQRRGWGQRRERGDGADGVNSAKEATARKRGARLSASRGEADVSARSCDARRHKRRGVSGGGGARA